MVMALSILIKYNDGLRYSLVPGIVYNVMVGIVKPINTSKEGVKVVRTVPRSENQP